MILLVGKDALTQERVKLTGISVLGQTHLLWIMVLCSSLTPVVKDRIASGEMYVLYTVLYASEVKTQ